MQKLIIVAIVLVAAYFLVTKVVDTTNSIEVEDSHDLHAQYKARKVDEKDKKYHVKDSIGQTVFNGTGLTLAEKKEIWSRSPLKDEMIHYFPKFDLIKMFTRNRIEDSDLRREVNKIVKDVENKFLSGQIDANKAKYELGQIK